VKENKIDGTTNWFSRHKILLSVIAILTIGIIVFFAVGKDVREKATSHLQINATQLQDQLVFSTKEMKEADDQDVNDINVRFVDGAYGVVSITIDSETFYAGTEGSQKDFVFGVSKLYYSVCKNNGLKLGCKTEIYSEAGRIIATGTGQGIVKIY
jgi:hypothetical protein